tara:strand:+ start:11851 stop:12072 length:222 start_codon:yes stop_codon:yes gene_type:complete
MKIYYVEVVHETSRHARVAVEAESQHEAIKKAQEISIDDFDDRAESNQTLWKAKAENHSFIDSLLSIFNQNRK